VLVEAGNWRDCPKNHGRKEEGKRHEIVARALCKEAMEGCPVEAISNDGG